MQFRKATLWTIPWNIPNCFAFDSMNRHWEMLCAPISQSISLFSPSSRGFWFEGQRLEWNAIAPFISYVTLVEGERVVILSDHPSQLHLSTNYWRPECKIRRSFSSWRRRICRNVGKFEGVNVDTWMWVVRCGNVGFKRCQLRLAFSETGGKNVLSSNLTDGRFGSVRLHRVKAFLALDRTVWSAGFGRGFGPVVRTDC
jgi:hypothetical protein